MENVEGISSFDKESFKQVVPLLALKIPAKKCSLFMKKLGKTGLLNKPRLKNVVSDLTKHEKDERLVLLSEKVTDEQSLAGLSDDQIQFIKENGATVVKHNLELGYEYLTAEQVLRKLLPDNLPEITTSFETAGHIAHLNLREHLLPFKTIIGQVILEKSPQIRTVVNKIKTIETQFRTFPMEVLAGKDDFNVTLREGGATFKFNFSEVYWNSRLQGEHTRLVGKINAQEIVADVFAGVGPFAIPLAMKKCKVFANDLNPQSYQYLCQNVKINKCQENIECFNEDGRAFIKRILQKAQKGTVVDHFVMNLPKIAIEFLDVLQELDWANINDDVDEVFLSMCSQCHVYCFEKSEDAHKAAICRVNKAMGSDIPEKLFKVHNVRDVAPKTPMLCLTFPVPLFLLKKTYTRQMVGAEESKNSTPVQDECDGDATVNVMNSEEQVDKECSDKTLSHDAKRLKTG